MKNIFILFFGTFALVSPATASVIKKVTLDGQQYSCRPSNIEPACNLKTDLGFTYSLTADSVDAWLCLADVGNDQSKVKNCFLQKRIKNYSRELDTQMISPACWKTFLSKCMENTACPELKDPEKRCGHLGTFYNHLREASLTHLFSETDAAQLCQSLINQ